MDEEKVVETPQESTNTDAIKELTKAVTDLVKEFGKLKEIIDKHFKAGRF
jgi:predicted nucleotide-binding protein (sugar kinase/HSP70/actin superfamily)